MLVLYSVPSIVLIIFLLTLIPVSFRLSVNNSKFSYKIKYLFFCIVNSEKPKAKSKSKVNGEQQKTEPKKINFKNAVKKVNDIFNIIFAVAAKIDTAVKHIVVNYITFDIEIANEDAAKAAINYGEVCAVLYPSLAIIESRVKKVKKQSGNVNCVYNSDENSVEFNLLANIKLIFLINAGIKILFVFINKKLKKGTVNNNER